MPGNNFNQVVSILIDLSILFLAYHLDSLDFYTEGSLIERFWVCILPMERGS